jgi:hypothetical protein
MLLNFLKNYYLCSICVIVLSMNVIVFANDDQTVQTLSCTDYRQNTAQGYKTNGTCNITEKNDGTYQKITKYHIQPCDSKKKDCSPHISYTGCSYGGWHHISTNYCWPTYACLGSGISTANAHIISPYELPDVG